MNLIELNLRTAADHGFAIVRMKITGPLDADGCVEITCVETVTNGDGQTIVFSDEGAGEGRA